MSKIFNHIKTYKTKYIIAVLFIPVFSMAFYILGNQENKIERLSNSVLMLNVYNAKNELSATGSGFIVFENDVLVTNYHVIEEGYKVEAVDENDVVYSLDKVVAFDKEKDLAILKFSSPTDLKVLKLHNSSKISKGDDIIAIGSPVGLKNTVSKGIISSIRKENDVEYLQITAPISSGSSGGALLNEKGKVVGITFAGIEDGQNLNFAIPSNEVSTLYENRLEEVTLQDFFFEQNPDEKYKLGCIEVSIADIKSGKYDGKDVYVSGWVPRLMDIKAPDDNYIFITNNKIKARYYSNSVEDTKQNKDLILLAYVLSSKKNSKMYDLKDEFEDLIWVDWSETKRTYNIKSGDYVTVYGCLSHRNDIRKIEDAIIEINE